MCCCVLPEQSFVLPLLLLRCSYPALKEYLRAFGAQPTSATSRSAMHIQVGVVLKLLSGLRFRG
jgi:hypothetical protein